MGIQGRFVATGKAEGGADLGPQDRMGIRLQAGVEGPKDLEVEGRGGRWGSSASEPLFPVSAGHIYPRF